MNGRPFLSYILDQIAKAGIGRAVLCIGFMGGLVREEFGTAHGPVALDYSQEDTPLGTAGALRLALPLLGSGTALIMNGDSYCNTGLSEFLSGKVDDSVPAQILSVRVHDTSRFGCLNIDDRGMILSFEEKGRRSGPGWINAGIYRATAALIAEISEGAPMSLENDVFPKLAENGRLAACRAECEFLDIGTPESYNEAERFFREIGARRHAHI